MSGPSANDPPGVCGAAVANPARQQRRRRQASLEVMSRMQARNLFSKFTSPKRSFTAALRQDSAHRWGNLTASHVATCAETGGSESSSLITGSR